MTYKQLLFYEKLYYNLLKQALKPTADFIEWYDQLGKLLQLRIYRYNQGLQYSVPYWVYMAFIEKIRQSTNKDQADIILSNAPLIKAFLVKAFVDLITVLDYWYSYNRQKKDKTTIDDSHSITSPYTLKNTRLLFFKQPDVSIKRNKNCSDLNLLQHKVEINSCIPSV